MSRWPWRRRAVAGPPAPEPARQVEPEARTAPEPAVRPLPDSEPGQRPDGGGEFAGGVSPARLDEALRRLRERTPAREDDHPVQPGG